MEDNKLDELVTRLPCGHIFHTPCIVDWLSNHSCSCPVCRYELPTDDPGYEAGRKQRMKSRKPRFAMHELKRMKVSHLYRLARGPVKGIVEKKDLIDSLIDNQWIDVVPDPDPVRYDLEVLKAMKIGELKRTMEEAGVFFRRGDVLMKSDMLSLFENSGRLIPIKSDPPVEEMVAPENYDTTTGDVATGKDQQCSLENTIGDSEFETLSAIDCNGDDFVIVETADDGSIIMDADDPADEEFDDRQSGSPIVMFPEQFDELMSRELEP